MKISNLLSGGLLVVALSACQKNNDTPAAADTSTPEPATESAAPVPAVVAADALVKTGSEVQTQPEVGKVEGTSVVSTGKPGFLMFGPYVAFAPGDYQLSVKGQVSNLAPETGVTFDVASTAGAIVHGSQVVTQAGAAGEIASIKFSIASQVNDLEIRANVPAGANVKIDSYEVSKSP